MNLLRAISLAALGLALLTSAHSETAPAGQPAPAQPGPITAAVLDFQSGDDRNKDAGAQIAALVSANLSAAAELALVERQDLEKILSENEIGISGAVTPESAAKIGGIVGAKILVVGRIIPSPKTNSVVAKVMATETGRVFAFTAEYPVGESALQAARQIAEGVVGVVKEHRNDFTVKVEPGDELIARLRKSVEGKKLPSVAVEIAEQHLTRPVPDPAAETELKLILGKVGFEVIDEAAGDRRAEILIKGEAFSELGLRKANLVACRARVEVKITPRDPAGKAGVERETASGIDLSEHVAAKNALQRAGAKLAERLVPQLACR